MTLKKASRALETTPAVRIAKMIAHAGVCSRRNAEKLIREGRVTVDGRILETPAFVVDPTQSVCVDGEPLSPPISPQMWLFHKPAGVVTTHRDPQGRKTVFDLITERHRALPAVISVGRLDLSSEGLLLLTTHRGIARHLELPSSGWPRRYRVRVFGTVTPDAIEALRGGLVVEGVRYASVAATFERQKGGNAWLSMTLCEGKNREIRKIAGHLGWKVNRLIRVAYGPFQLGSLPIGAVKEVPLKVIQKYFGEAIT